MMQIRKKLILILIVIGLGVLSIVWFVYTKKVSSHGLRICPEEMVIEAKAGPDRSGQESLQDSEDIVASGTSMYILNGKKMPVSDFDTAWIAENCQVPITNK